ncbi:hypothetical protein K0U07_01690 [bacterium]|nr:hypothetical protein [bacterium]
MKKGWLFFLPLWMFANPLAYFSTKNGEIAIVDPKTNSLLKNMNFFWMERVAGSF